MLVVATAPESQFNILTGWMTWVPRTSEWKLIAIIIAYWITKEWQLVYPQELSHSCLEWIHPSDKIHVAKVKTIQSTSTVVFICTWWWQNWEQCVFCKYLLWIASSSCSFISANHHIIPDIRISFLLLVKMFYIFFLSFYKFSALGVILLSFCDNFEMSWNLRKA